MATMHKVVAGDTLWTLANKYGTTVDNIVKLNNIKNPDYIVVGQVLQIDGTKVEPAKTTTSKVRIDVWGLVSNTTGPTRQMFVSWSFDQSNVSHYLIKWQYCVIVNGKEVSAETSPTQINTLFGTYSPDDSTTRVKVAIKPVAKTRKVNGKDTPYFTGAWAWSSVHIYSNDPPSAPPVPTVTRDGDILTATLDNLDAKVMNAKQIEFAAYKDNATSACKTITAKIDALGYCSATFSTLAVGSTYKFRARAKRDSLYSAWSDYTSNYGTRPASISKLTKCEGKTETSVLLEWEAAKGAKTYEIEYATDTSYFDGSDAVTKVTDIKSTSYEKTGLDSGIEYFFRVRALNDEGETGWSETSSVIIGTSPEAPTTWSSTTTAIAGEPLTLFWVHNSSDNSKQSKAEIELTIDGNTTYIPINTPNKEDKTYHYDIPDTSRYTEGTKIRWRVRTAGATGLLSNLLSPGGDDDSFSEWSALRTIDVYAQPVVELSLTDASGAQLGTLTQFPIKVQATTYPSTQKPIGYHIEILVAQNEFSYEIMDEVGNTKMVGPGDRVYSGYFDTSEDLNETLSANDMSLENGVKYEVICVASMDSSLTAEATGEFDVSWTSEQYEPNASIIIDTDLLCTYISPYCRDADDNLIEGVTLSVYRRDFDGGFTELASNLPNTGTYFPDPHPALDYARYRIVAKFPTTGAVSYYDVPGQPLGVNAIVLQWDETWREFEGIEGIEEEIGIPLMSGSMIKLFYNIDVSEDASPDAELVEYIGRSHPVAYYGTHKGETATWSAAIPKSDIETLSALRRLQTWTGNVYAREPSGTGYWANVTISFGQKHTELTIPITISLTRVEGGA